MASLRARSLFLLEKNVLKFDGMVWGGEGNMTYFKAGIN
jgi:hypothetical protein